MQQDCHLLLLHMGGGEGDAAEGSCDPDLGPAVRRERLSITSGDPAVTRVTVADVLPWQPCQWTQGWRTQEDLSGPSGSEIVWDRESMVGGMFGVTTETPSVSNHNKAVGGGGS